MRGEERRQRAMLMVIDPEQRVPQDHPLRRIKELADAALDGAVAGVRCRCTARWGGRRSRPSGC